MTLEPPFDLAATTLELVAIPSVSELEEALAEHVLARLRPRFGEPRWREGTSFVLGGRDPAAGGAGAKRPVIAFAAHLDTVPPAAGLVPRRDAESVHGCGSTDLKGGMAVMLALAEAFPAGAGAADLLFLFYGCEEIALSKNQLRPLLAACPWLADECALAICVEPTDNYVEVGCLGTMHARVTVTGKAAHSARPWLGENAIHKGAALITRVAQRPERVVDLSGVIYREVMNVTTVEGGGARNVIPGRFTLNINFRFGPDRSPEDAIQDLRAMFAGEAEVEIVDLAPSGRVCLENPWVQRLVAVAGTGSRAKQAWTDVAQLTALGIDAVNFGPGIPGKAHQADEYVPIANLNASYRALHRLLIDGV